eukprot:Lankesteria_metandrocarpae@DN4454_c0_g1_i1.p2
MRWLCTYFMYHHLVYIRSYTVLALEGAVLTYGQDLAAVYFYTPTEWGVWGLVSNVGGAVCRLLFNPVESAASAMFSTAHPSTHEEVAPLHASTIRPGEYCTEQTTQEEENEYSSNPSFHWDIFKHLVFLQSLVGLLGASFGPCISFTCVRLLYGTQWADHGAAQLLSSYCYLLALMATNGMLEAYVHARASAAWLCVCEKASIIFSAVFVCCLVFSRVVLGFGIGALIISNVAVIVLRVIFAVWYIYKTELQRLTDKKRVHSLRDMKLVVRAMLPQQSLTVFGIVCVVGFVAQLHHALAVRKLNGVSRIVSEAKVVFASLVVIFVFCAKIVYKAAIRLAQLLTSTRI